MMICHDTIRLEQAIGAPPARVFAAYADPVARAIWSAPSETAAVRIDACDFRTGGAETAFCGAKDDLRYSVDIRYHLVEPDRIVFTEAVHEGATLLTVGLVAITLTIAPGGARLSLTDQVTSFVGQEGIDGHRQGYRQSLSRLAAWLTAAGGDRPQPASASEAPHDPETAR